VELLSARGHAWVEPTPVRAAGCAIRAYMLRRVTASIPALVDTHCHLYLKKLTDQADTT